MPPKFDPLALQANVRNNSADITSFISELSSWEDSIKEKDKKIRKGDLNPTYKSAKAVSPLLIISMSNISHLSLCSY